tara:strand:+ start:379 stop:549 length:171 start_codon:yes stop_codon:yes gene_type:complete
MFRTKKNKKFNYKPKYIKEKESKKKYFKQKTVPKSKKTVIIFLIMLFLFLSILFFS